MKLEFTIGCAACGFSKKVSVNSKLDCSTLICPKCKNEDCLSIISVSEIVTENFRNKDILKRLEMIRQL